MISEIKQQLSQIGLNKINIDGGNISLEDVDFKSLLEHWAEDSPELKSELNSLQSLMEEIYDQSMQSKPKNLEIKDNKVIIPEGTIVHSTSAISTDSKKGYAINDSLKCISIAGVLASEWFGNLESSRECAFCASGATVRYNINPEYGLRVKEQKDRMGERNFCVYFDTQNPLMQKLLRLDYYEYARMKKEEPDKIAKTYNEEEIAIFENLILPNSKGGKCFHYSENQTLKNYDWVAIPGGIPAQLINGISVGHKNPAIDFVYEISEMFPNVTIFGEDGFVLAMPKSKMENENLRKEIIDKKVKFFKLQKQLDEKSNKIKKYSNEIENLNKRIINYLQIEISESNEKINNYYNCLKAILEEKFQELKLNAELIKVNECNNDYEILVKKNEMADLQIDYLEENIKPLSILKNIIESMQIISTGADGVQITEEYVELLKNNLPKNEEALDRFIEEEQRRNRGRFK